MEKKLEFATIVGLEEHQLFANRGTLNEAMQYADDIIKQIPTEGGGRLAAYTAAYVLYNTAVRYYKEQIETHNDQ
jgi:hypothetical protein